MFNLRYLSEGLICLTKINSAETLRENEMPDFLLVNKLLH